MVQCFEEWIDLKIASLGRRVRRDEGRERLVQGKEAGDLATSEDFTAKLMDDMDPALLDFVKNQVNSFIKWDLVRFFHENPNTTDTAENIARYAGRHVDAVQPELEELVKSEVMQKRVLDQTSVYALIKDEKVRRLVDQLIQACEDRHFRVKAVYHIIKNLR